MRTKVWHLSQSFCDSTTVGQQNSSLWYPASDFGCRFCSNLKRCFCSKLHDCFLACGFIWQAWIKSFFLRLIMLLFWVEKNNSVRSLLTVDFAILKVRFHISTFFDHWLLLVELIWFKFELICRRNAVFIRQYSLNYEAKLYWLANLCGSASSIQQWVREGVSIPGWHASINYDLDLNLGLFGHLSDEYGLGNFQIWLVFV